MSKLGEFDSYIMDAQEAAMRQKYQEYLNDNDPADVLSFEDFCEYQQRNEP